MTQAEVEPQHCPFCGGIDITLCVPWAASSLEPADLGNTAELDEYQCIDCEGRSFWV